MGVDLKLGSPASGAVITSPFGKAQPYEGVWDGTIALWDGGFDSVAGVPANGSIRTNLMRNRLAEISGLSLGDCDFAIENTTANGFAAVERTSKGGLHVASTQAGSAQNAQSNLAFKPSSAFEAWLLSQTDAGADYAVMLTQWLRPTRASIAPSVKQAIAWFVNIASATGNYHFHAQGGEANSGRRLDTDAQGTVTGMPGCQFVDLGTLVPATFAVASKGWQGTKPASGSSNMILASQGCAGAWNSFNFNKAGSAIIYRVQMDLVNLAEIAGATVADKANAMLAAQNSLRATAFAAGGRFADDVFTPAATLKP